MSAHTREEFDLFMSQLLETNANLAFYTDFKKCYKNVRDIAIKLNTLNYLLGSENLDLSIKDLWDNDHKVFSVLSILIAVRSNYNTKVLDNKGTTQAMSTFLSSYDGVVTFIKETGLAEVFMKKQIKNLVDYVFGIEVGLDTNARKNRSGKLMEAIVSDIFTKAGVEFRREVYSTEFPNVAKVLGRDIKRFDFVINTQGKTYLIEVNFYSGGGSKLNEVARSYSDISPKINSVDGFEFVWVTDGIGWNSARTKLEEAFYIIPSIYNLTTITNFLTQIK